MTSPLQIAQKYFELSNQADLNAIEKMFTDTSTYSSVNTGVFYGRKQIIDMVRPFYDSFDTLNWDVHDVKEIRPNVIEFDFTFKGVKNDKETVRHGIEYVIVNDDGLLQHVEVRNKNA